MRGAVAGIGLAGALARVAAAVCAPGLALAQEGATTSLPEIRVIATTPLAPPSTRVVRPARAPAAARPAAPAAPSPPAAPGDPTLIDRDKVPSDTQTLTAADLTRAPSANLTD